MKKQKLIFAFCFYVLSVFSFASCDTIGLTDPFGVWIFYDNADGASYKQQLSITEEGDYVWDFYKNSEIDETFIKSGTWLLENDNENKVLAFAYEELIDPEGPQDGEKEAKSIKYNFMIKDDGNTLVLAQLFEGRWISTSYTLSKAAEGVINEKE